MEYLPPDLKNFLLIVLDFFKMYGGIYMRLL
jgi:hypothetical protein